jgi:hypothetical protein
MFFTGAVSAFGSDPIVISGASSTDGISITTSSGTVTYPLSLENTTNADIKSVKIEISDLVGPNSHTWDARLLNPQSSPAPSQSLTVNIPRFQKVNLILTARAPEAGLYQSSLALIYGNKRYPILSRSTGLWSLLPSKSWGSTQSQSRAPTVVACVLR